MGAQRFGGPLEEHAADVTLHFRRQVRLLYFTWLLSTLSWLQRSWAHSRHNHEEPLGSFRDGSRPKPRVDGAE